ETLALAETWRPDAIVHETGEFSALVAGDALRVPTIRVGVALVSPFEDWWLRVAAEALDELRADVGAAADPGARRGASTPLLTLAPPSLDRGHGEPPALVRRFRDDRVARARAAAVRIPSADHDDMPFVPISFGTAVPTNHFPDVYRAALDAVADLPVRVLMTTGVEVDPAELGPLPANVRVERWAPIGALLAGATAFVTHGGAGTTVAALAAGVPMVVLPMAADQPFNARIVADAGAGVAVEGGPAAGPPRLGEAVREVLDDPRYASAARALADEIGGLPPITDAVEAIETYAGVATGATPAAIG
ncbi:MAG TPA: glycosyltransferase, partial [Baekduia sp.]